jgi:hypothetical protein
MLVAASKPAIQIARSECMYTPRMRADENPNHFKISVQTFDASRQNGSCVLILHSRTHNQLTEIFKGIKDNTTLYGQIFVFNKRYFMRND